jgi:hypothetical protein
MVYLSSEESAIRLVEPELDKSWIPMGGEAVIVRLKENAVLTTEKAANPA